jgi:ABC-type transport system substrate-binding protein
LFSPAPDDESDANKKITKEFTMQTPFRLPLLTALILATTAAWAADAPVKGGTLIYLEQQAHTNLYPPAGGFYPNGGILNQITDKLTWQNPKTLQVEPWVAESWTTNADKTEYTFKIRPASPSPTARRWTPTPWRKTLIPTA